jgi:DNA replication licensing factor MCM3
VPNHRLRAWNETVQRQLLQRPAEYLPGFQDAIRDYIRGLDSTASLVADTEVFVGISGEFGALELSPRELGSAQLGSLVKVYGIVTKCSLVRPKLVKSVHYCPDTQVSMAREYRDVTALVGLPTGASYPTRDAEGHLLVTEYGRCRYRDNQVITMQELPETAPPGQLPHSGAFLCFVFGVLWLGGHGGRGQRIRSVTRPINNHQSRHQPSPPPPITTVDIVLENDLVDAVKPGDRVAVVGLFRPLAGAANGATSGVYR